MGGTARELVPMDEFFYLLKIRALLTYWVAKRIKPSRKGAVFFGGDSYEARLLKVGQKRLYRPK